MYREIKCDICQATPDTKQSLLLIEHAEGSEPYFACEECEELEEEF